MKTCVIIPTLNEEKNINKIFNKIKKTKLKTDILFVDDNSNDNSQSIIKSLKKKYKFVKFIFRKNKFGIGSAHKDGFKYVYKKKYDLIITMDCDGTHDPKYFKKMVRAADFYDYVLTSRFNQPYLIDDWPLHRKILTQIRHILVKIFLNLNYDASGAFRCFYREKIKLSDLLSAKNNEYAFFWEITYILNKKKYLIYEIPVKLIYRKLGKSKMKFIHIFGSLFYLVKVFFSK
tara:strand:+ start:174 stop:869 length:696 start_codon:yes stop_codon:yes gene_type:complete